MSKHRKVNQADTIEEVIALLGDDKSGGIWVGENYSLKQLKEDLANILGSENEQTARQNKEMG